MKRAPALKVPLLVTLVLGSAIVLSPVQDLSCPDGYHLVDLKELRMELRFGSWARAAEAGGEADGDEEWACLSNKHPEPFAELAGLSAELAAKTTAPFASVRPGAYRAALAERDAVAAASPDVPGSEGIWVPYGRGPLISNHEDYGNVNGLGLVELNGRIDSLDYDPAAGRLFALIGTGGVWMSEDLGQTWSSIGDGLPTQINGAVAWTPAGGGTVVVVGGEPLMGGNTYTGLGAFWTNDLGETWHQATGVPDGALGFQVAVDPTNQGEVYAATTKGLFRSTNAGRDFVNTNLPTAECAGQTDFQRCMFANFVTDVVIQSPDTFGNTGGAVLAAVGYRSNNRVFPGTAEPESPANGLYGSDTGEPGSFTKLPGTGFAPQERIGRTELGVAEGPEQNHDYVYAIVQDAVHFNGGVPVIDAPDPPGPAIPNNTSFNGIYVSADFGQTWTKMGDDTTISENPATGSALAGTGQALLFAPGVQAWYNEWIKPDPTRHVGGVPTRVTFGLEEVWQNEFTTLPANGPTSWKVIGRYFSDEACLLLDTGVPACPTNRPPQGGTTTHPDQHDAIWIPDGQGGVSLMVGNDGGAYVATVAEGAEIDNGSWGDGNNDGFHTLLPYDADMAKDGTVWYGMQDNGSGKIVPGTQEQFMTFGGDGFFVAVDPDNSDIAYSETTFAAMRVTTDGGVTWRYMDPFLANTKFSNPFVMDPLDANHLMTAGNSVVESTFGPETQQLDPSDTVCIDNCWVEVFALGNAPSGAANSMSALDLHGDAAYVGYCGVCDVISVNRAVTPFQNGLATNVGGAEPPERMTPNGWHVAAAQGLPNRYINSIAIDPVDPQIVYVALSGYANRQWVPPGSYLDQNPNIGTGHVYRSTDAGQTFTDVSSNLPDAPAFWIEVVGDQVVVGTQVGVFMSSDATGSEWAVLGTGLPNVPISTLSIAPQDPSMLVAATFGRGVYTYQIPPSGRMCRGEPATIVGTTQADEIVGTTGKDVIYARGGNDVIDGGGGNDVICGGAGRDLLTGGPGRDALLGSRDADTLRGGGGNDLLNGAKGDDVLVGGAGDDDLAGRVSDDRLNGGTGNDRLRGGPGRDRLIGGGGTDFCGGGERASGCERGGSAR